MFSRCRFFINKNVITINLRNITSQNQTTCAAKYVSNIVERDKYEKWMQNIQKDKLSESNFRIMLPPPNITGTLHLGHALTITIQDTLVRLNKMKGNKTLWIPGMDHAGIATQVIVEKKLWSEKKIRRQDLGREKFIEEVFKWKAEKEGTIHEQMKKLGALLDWDTEFFTMDEKRTNAVNEAFVKLFDEGLIYRENKLINWCCVLQSAISDIEVDYLEINKRTKINVPNYDTPIEFGLLTTFAYKIVDSDDEILVSTTRPETILGDVALAIHPNDSRYTKYHNKYVFHPFRKEAIPIVVDDFVDRDFGTGVVKITPAHDPVDFDVGKRHKLNNLSVIGENGLMTFEGYEQVKRFEARVLIVEKLSKMGLLRGIDDHSMKIPVCSRSKDVIEYIIKPQWFLRCKKMAADAINDVRDGRLVIEPKVFEKVWYNWLENIHDWCISRQLWWGHQIPAYECTNNENNNNKIWVAAINKNEASKKAAILLKTENFSLKRDQDVLDTWFSSSILPFSTQTNSNSTEIPLTLMETGHDILFFWVARMIMLGKKLTSKLPFDKILLHGIICDSHGRKMSKSLGNVVFPENVINGTPLHELNSQITQMYSAGLFTKDEYNKAIAGQKKMFPNGIPQCGADALRLTLLSHNIKSHFINFDIQECHTNALFCNKIWQALKFIELKTDIVTSKYEPGYIDKWILSRLSFMLNEVNESLDSYDFHLAVSALKKFLYSEFCDVYIEAVKPALKNRNNEASGHFITLVKCLENSLRCLAPFMPFVTEELYKYLPQLLEVPKVENLLYGPFPKPTDLRNEPIEKEIDLILEVATTIRRLKKLFNISVNDRSTTFILSDKKLFYDQIELIKTLSVSNDLTVASDFNLDVVTVSDTIGKFGIVKVEIPKNKIESINKERDRMVKKIDKLVIKIDKLKNTVEQDSFKINAPADVQKTKFDQLEAMEKELNQLKELERSYNLI